MQTRRAINASNANMQAVADAAALYGVRAYRMQSRTFTVEGAGGRSRPMFMGGWNDRTGIFHAKGMADFLLTPKIQVSTKLGVPIFASVALWCECKSGMGALTADQKAFRDDVLDAGAFWLCCHDSCEELIAWFKKHGVTR